MTPPVRFEDRPSVAFWKNGRFPVVGVVGGIGGGKTAVAQGLAARGAIVIVADRVGHEILDQPAMCQRVIERFGSQVANADGAPGPPRIDRRALGKIVFADPAARADLEHILHPLMRRQFEELIASNSTAATLPLCVALDAAVLFEAGWNDLCDRVVFVDAPRAERLRRVSLSRGWTDEMLAARENAQWPVEEKRRRADFVIDNDAGEDHLDREIDRLVASLRNPIDHSRSPASPFDTRASERALSASSD
jgi:dephospho-CoA kinase